MRQAGRCLPEYQALKARHSLNELFGNPELAAEITLQPVRTLGVDAAILFADILTLPIALGADIHFDNDRGPVVRPLKDFNLKTVRSFPAVEQTIRAVKKALPGDKALIGFAGSPFTVLTYLLEGGSSVNFTRTLRMMGSDPEGFRRLMELLTTSTIQYLNAQKEAGIDAFQIFDTWAGILPVAPYDEFVKPFIREIFAAVDLPSIYYLRQCAHLLPSMAQSGADILSVCHTVDLADPRVVRFAGRGVQGNLYNGLLYADPAVTGEEVTRLLKASTKYDRYIFNLSHGVFPDTPVDTLKMIVKLAHDFTWKR
jgi:uroporphyrinogen decarboxylase